MPKMWNRFDFLRRPRSRYPLSYLVRCEGPAVSPA